MADDTAFVPRTELEERFHIIEDAVKSNSTRLAAVEKASADMQTAQTSLTKTLQENSVKLDDIYTWVTKANGVWGFVRRHGPKLGYFAVGIAISKGWISNENGHNFLSIFGIGG